jgi:hypothetical protein
MANPNAETSLIAAQSAVTGETPEVLAAKIKAKSAQLAAFSGLVIGLRRNFLTAIAGGQQIEYSALDAALAAALIALDIDAVRLSLI